MCSCVGKTWYDDGGSIVLTYLSLPLIAHLLYNLATIVQPANNIDCAQSMCTNRLGRKCPTHFLPLITSRQVLNSQLFVKGYNSKVKKVYLTWPGGEYEIPEIIFYLISLSMDLIK